MCDLKVALSVSTLLILCMASGVRAQCQAPKWWFPHTSISEPDFHAPQNNCEFHQWSWQTFLWLTKPTGKDRIQLLDLPTAEELLRPGLAPATFDITMKERLRQQPLYLFPRVVKRSAPNKFDDIRQAGSRGILVDQNGRAVYYAIHVSQIYYQHVRANRLFIKENYVKQPPGNTFPIGSLAVKSSWRILLPGESTAGLFTTSARVYRLICENGANHCQGEDVQAGHRTERVKVALIGIHLAGVVEDHPEFIWSTFEHGGNAPDLPAGMSADSAAPVSGGTWTFYCPNTPAKDCNVANAGTVTLDVRKQELSPKTNVFRQFPLGGGDVEDQENIKSLNESVHAQLETKSVWKNYFLVGSVWLADGTDSLEPGLEGACIQRRAAGSVRLSNTTMETFTQLGRKNCFSCHDTGARGELPAMNMNLSHVLIDGLVQRHQLPEQKSLAVSLVPIPLKSYADVRRLLNDFVNKNHVRIEPTPYGEFWNEMSYEEFIKGDIPHVSNPEGKPLKVLVVKNSKESNLILALRGARGTVFDPRTGSIGRLPPSGPFMNDTDIARIAEWIDLGCPNKP